MKINNIGYSTAWCCVFGSSYNMKLLTLWIIMGLKSSTKSFLFHGDLSAVPLGIAMGIMSSTIACSYIAIYIGYAIVC